MNGYPLKKYLLLLNGKGLLINLCNPPLADSTSNKNGIPLSRCVSGLYTDSRECKEGGIFFCKGRSFSALYLTEAVRTGAVAVIYEPVFLDKIKGFEEALNSAKECAVIIEVSSVKKVMALFSAFHNGYPMKKAVTVAVTGTKGKTSVVTAIKDVLNAHAGFKAMILNEALPHGSPHLTTPEAIPLHAAARECIDKGASHVICEVSSQGIKELRTHGIIFDVACFLNFDRDHVSEHEHPSENDYFLSKAALFSFCKRAVINADCQKAQEVIKVAESSSRILTDAHSGKRQIFTFGTESKCTDFHCTLKEKNAMGSLIEVTEKGDTLHKITVGKKPSHPLYVSAPGEFNVSNALATFSVCRVLGCTSDECFRGILLSRPEGRMEAFDTVDGKVRIVVDYAHNKMSFEALFRAVREMYNGAPPGITAIFGCSGEKAPGRRYDLPFVALKHADRIIITEDDSGKEPFENIKNDVLRSIEKITLTCKDKDLKNAKISVIRDRERAVLEAVSTAYENGERRLILFTGRGRESTMRRESGEVFYESDVSFTQRAVKRYNDRVRLDSVFCDLGKMKEKTVTVSFENNATLIRNFVPSAVRLLSAGVNVIAVCKAEGFALLREECYKNGTVCHGISYRPYDTESIEETVKRTAKRGALTVLLSDVDEKKAAVEIAVREKSDALVYLTHSGGIILNGKPFSSVVSEEVCNAVSKRFTSRYLELATEATLGGVDTVAVIDGREREALSFFSVGHGFLGTVIKKDKNA